MNRWTIRVMVLGLALGAGFTGRAAPQAGPAADLAILVAAWRDGRAALDVGGSGEAGAEVRVYDADSGDFLGSTGVRPIELWGRRFRDLTTPPCRVRAESGDQSVERDVAGAPPDCGVPPGGDLYRVLAANDLGMHCADKDYQIFSILPPFNVVHGQVIERGSAGASPRLLGPAEAGLTYHAVSNPRDPVAPDSINTTSANSDVVFKSNFWQGVDGGRTLGPLAYDPLYPSVDKLDPLLCDPLAGPCPSALTLFEPLATDLGLPVPDPVELPLIVTSQQTAPSVLSRDPFVDEPYTGNHPQGFERFDGDLPFFADFPFGTVVQGANWWAADGIPMLPVDDQGRENAYPLMRISATVGNPQQVVASTDVVLPVASEADCQGCHADVADFGNGAATNFASVQTYAAGNPWIIAREADSPPPEPLLNAAKINILRLHDAKHGAGYVSSADLSPRPCMDGSEPSCLDNRRPIQCSQCHYSPALDLAQVGPVDEPEQGDYGRQQLHHVSMSRAMHEFHGGFADLFPAMPPPRDANGAPRDPDVAARVLEETCYQCHPGKRTRCLRGAMFNGGVVCQDCHGDMSQVGNDFTAALPTGGDPDFDLRVPWANEPGCQSCHIGDALSLAGRDLSDFYLADDGIRLLQAYRKSDAGNPDLPHNQAPDSRFAENQVLYRLSQGHGGVMCEGCHGSTHAIWPVQPAPDTPDAPFLANDNLAALDLQGHTGTLAECDTCHGEVDLGLTMEGPHGMHPVGAGRWNRDHEDVAEHNGDACRSCHGLNGEGTVLSRMATTRTLICKEAGRGACGADKRITLARGHQVSCSDCHGNELGAGGLQARR